MITLLSPAKDLDFTPKTNIKGITNPQFLEKSEKIAGVLRKKSEKQLGELMGLSEKLVSLNFERFQEWSAAPNGNGKTALHAFNGEVYRSLDANSLKTAELNYAQDHVRILSGLYGMLRPKDVIMPYRLEMGTKLPVARKKNLYDFWGNEITDALNAQIAETKSRFVVNLSSNEYFKSIQKNALDAPVITPVFKDLTAKGEYKTKFFYAKKQRGKMTRFIIKHHALEPKVLLNYDVDGYYYSEKDSTDNQLVFLRDKVQ